MPPSDFSTPGASGAMTDRSCGGRPHRSVEQRPSHQAALLFDLAFRQLTHRGPLIPVGLHGFGPEHPRLDGRRRRICVKFHAPIIWEPTVTHNAPIGSNVFNGMNTAVLGGAAQRRCGDVAVESTAFSTFVLVRVAEPQLQSRSACPTPLRIPLTRHGQLDGRTGLGFSGRVIDCLDVRGDLAAGPG
jgi:hypothetical protein